MIGRAARCSSGRPTPPRPGRSGRPSPPKPGRSGRPSPPKPGRSGRPSPSSGQRQGKAGAGAGREDGQKKKPGQAARCVRCCSGFASLPAWWCRAAGLPGAVVVLIGGRRRALIPGAQFQPPQFQPEPFQGGTVSPPYDPAKSPPPEGSDSSLYVTTLPKYHCNRDSSRPCNPL